jgi:retron-type reverse transcriptase
MTPGSDGKTIDGFSLSMIEDIIQEMRTEQFQFKPVRTVYIDKQNGKKRKLGIPSARDKIVQEVIRMILECIYDSGSLLTGVRESEKGRREEKAQQSSEKRQQQHQNRLKSM